MESSTTMEKRKKEMDRRFSSIFRMGWDGKKGTLLSEHIHIYVTVTYILSLVFYTHHIEYFGWIPAWLEASKQTAYWKWKGGD